MLFAWVVPTVGQCVLTTTTSAVTQWRTSLMRGECRRRPAVHWLTSLPHLLTPTYRTHSRQTIHSRQILYLLNSGHHSTDNLLHFYRSRGALTAGDRIQNTLYSADFTFLGMKARGSKLQRHSFPPSQRCLLVSSNILQEYWLKAES